MRAKGRIRQYGVGTEESLQPINKSIVKRPIELDKDGIPKRIFIKIAKYFRKNIPNYLNREQRRDAETKNRLSAKHEARKEEILKAKILKRKKEAISIMKDEVKKW